MNQFRVPEADPFERGISSTRLNQCLRSSYTLDYLSFLSNFPRQQDPLHQVNMMEHFHSRVSSLRNLEHERVDNSPYFISLTSVHVAFEGDSSKGIMTPQVMRLMQVSASILKLGVTDC